MRFLAAQSLRESTMAGSLVYFSVLWCPFSPRSPLRFQVGSAEELFCKHSKTLLKKVLSTLKHF